jgi:hypothetical protein
LELKQLKSLEHYLRDLIDKNLWEKVMLALALGVGAGVILSPDMGFVTESTSTPGSIRFTILRCRLNNFKFNLLKEGDELWHGISNLLNCPRKE